MYMYYNVSLNQKDKYCRPKSRGVLEAVLVGFCVCEDTLMPVCGV